MKWPWHASIYKLSDPDSSESVFDASSNETVDDVTTMNPPLLSAEMKSPVSGYHCGGTLVHAFHLGFVVLTAAHCFKIGRASCRERV